jgi:hypothetical protein
MGKPFALQRDWFSGIQQQQLVQPTFDLVVERIPDGVSHAHLSEPLETIKLVSPCALLPDLLQQLEGEGAASALVAVDGAGQEEVVSTEEGLDVGKGNSCSLVNHH